MSIGKNLWIRFLMFFGGMLCLAFISPAQIPGIDASTSFYQGTVAGPQLSVVSFGDSIASGFDSQNIFQLIDGGPYGDHFGYWLEAETSRSVLVNNIAYAGYTMAQIFGVTSNNQASIQQADIVFIEGGGNDLLNLDGNSTVDMCEYSSYYPAATAIHDNFINALNTITQNLKPGARVAVIGFYYPLVNAMKQRPCYGETLSMNTGSGGQAYENFIDVLALINWEYRAVAFANGYGYADAFSKVNCNPANESTCSISNFSSEEDYREGLHSFDDRGILQDMQDLGYAQADDTHPNFAGHYQIMRAIVANVQ